jgi:hypothetical protein
MVFYDEPLESVTLHVFCMNFMMGSMEAVMYSQLLEGLKCESQIENNGRARTWGTLPGSQHYRGIRGACWSSGMGLGRNDKLQSLTRTCIKPTPSG